LIRYCLEGLFEDQNVSKFLIPHSFITFSTPHLGIQRCGGSFSKEILKLGINVASRYFLGKSTLELSMQDEKQILLQMCQENHLMHLRKFKHSTLVGLVAGDQFSPFSTSNVCQQNPYKVDYIQESKHGLSFVVTEKNNFNEDIKMIENQSLLEIDLKEMKNFQKDQLEEVYFSTKMMENLNTIPWRRLNLILSFPKYKSVLSVDKWLIQIHNLPIGNVFLSRKEYGDELVSSLQDESCKFLLEFVQILKLDLEE
jgi:hypothetical protein